MIPGAHNRPDGRPQSAAFRHNGVTPDAAVRWYAAALALVMVLVGTGSLRAEAPPWYRHDPNQPWHITADQINQDRASGIVTASGNVIISQTNKRLSARFVRYNQRTMELMAEGDVVLTAGGDILTGDRVNLNLRDETGVLIGATLFSQATQFRIAGERIEKRDKDSYRLEKGSVTTCEGDRPAWRITCRSMDVTVEGYGVARGAALRVLDVPVLYSPIMAFPVKIARQSGLLVPQFGSSERKGLEYNQPLFWAINDHSDATFYWNHMQERGEKLGGEYRYIAAGDTFGTVMADGFEDRQIDDGTPATEKWGYPDDGYGRTNTGRYWLRMKHDLDLGNGMTAKFDADIVSDQDYLKEFQTGYTGYDETDRYFVATFGRGLDDVDDIERLNLANFSKTWERFILTADARWYDNAVDRSQGRPSTTLQYLPDLTLSGARQPVMDTPLVASGAGQYVYFYREQGETGHRLDVYPRLYWPMTLQRRIHLEPSVGVRETLWYLDRDSAGGPPTKRQYARPMVDAKLDASTELYRIYGSPGTGIGRWRHLMRPQVVYAYVPGQDQNDLPYFDDTDRIAAQNGITYSLTNTMTTRRMSASTAAASTTDPAAPPAVSYHETARLKLAQTFDINAAGDPDPKPFSPVYAELLVTPREWFSLRADANWSVSDTRFEDHNLRLWWGDAKGNMLSLEHRYTRESAESLYAGGAVWIWEGLGAYGSIERDVYNGETIENRIGLRLNRQCWSLDTRYTETPNNREISFLVTLHGLGGIGSGFSPTSLAGGD